MSFVPINSSEISPGKPVASTTQTKIKENFDDHEARLQAAEVGSSSYPPIVLRVNGFYSYATQLTGVIKTTTNFALAILGVRILVDKAGTAGTLEIDIKRKRGAGAWESVLTTKPTIGYAAGDDALSVAGVLDPTKVNILAGDILRLDITSVQTGGKGFLVRVDFNRSV